MNRLAIADHWFGDGTFSITPSLFYQVYVVLFEPADGVHAALYALLPNKRTDTYEKLFFAIKSLIPYAQPQYFSTDYELAVINSFKSIFPGTDIVGCLFHLMQNIRKKVSDSDLLMAYRNDPEIALQIRMLGALSFVPLQFVITAFEQLQEIVDKRLEPLLNYFEDYYIGRPNQRGWKTPQFAIQWWNVHDRTRDGLHRSNNYTKSAHCRLQYEMGMI